MTSLSGFLLARIAEDEAVASGYEDRASSPHGSHLTDTPGVFSSTCPTCLAGWPGRERFLAECAAKRAIVELCATPMVDITRPREHPRRFIPGEGMPWGEPVIRQLASVYADHPDYRAEWKL